MESSTLNLPLSLTASNMKTLRSGLGAVLVVFSSLISVSLQSLDSPANDGCGKASQELAQVYGIHSHPLPSPHPLIKLF